MSSSHGITHYLKISNRLLSTHKSSLNEQMDRNCSVTFPQLHHDRRVRMGAGSEDTDLSKLLSCCLCTSPELSLACLFIRTGSSLQTYIWCFLQGKSLPKCSRMWHAFDMAALFSSWFYFSRIKIR